MAGSCGKLMIHHFVHNNGFVAQVSYQLFEEDSVAWS